MKMVMGCRLMAAVQSADGLRRLAWRRGKISWLWLAAYFVILTVGEIYLYAHQPVALFQGGAAPHRLADDGGHFLPNFLGGGFLQGWLGTFWDKMDQAAFFLMIAAIVAVAGPDHLGDRQAAAGRFLKKQPSD